MVVHNCPGRRCSRFLFLGLALACLLDQGALAQGLPLGGSDHHKYLAFDQATHRLFIAHDTEITVVDVTRHAVVAHLGGFAGARGVAIAANGKLYATDGKAAKVLVFDARSDARLATIPAGADAEAIVYDPVSRRIFAMNDDAGTVTVIDPASDSPVGTIPLGGGEGVQDAAADGQGHLYLVHGAAGELVRIDTRAGKVDARQKLPGCAKPQGLALDVKGGRAFVSCAAGTLVVLHTRSGRALGAAQIGPDSQTVIFDAGRSLLYTANADATVSVLQVPATGPLRPLPAIPTGAGARTAAEDFTTGTLYLVVSPATLLTRAPLKS